MVIDSVLHDPQSHCTCSWLAMFPLGCDENGSACLQDQKSTKIDIEKQGKKSNRSSTVEVLLVRSIEKEVENIKDQLKATAWNGLLTPTEGLQVLQVWPHLRMLYCETIASCCQH